ncbi:MAG: FAD binding domain-containing protein [Clostridiales Family XIII bacterium]|jgi:NADPH-dependent glutamate synthase beta subunit-like oxidoreductase/CO/xanthine dehydrogenase FAD-binding subunit|nr:FAD binding domain-containing protein [Clostridiales Family XIII bacterium]
MKSFEHIRAKSVDEAAQALRGGAARPLGGGTDLIGSLKDNILPDYPEAVVSLAGIEALTGIAEAGGSLQIGALTRLADIAASPLVRERYTALAEAAGRVASPNIRNMATLGGNLAQMNRCWYFRKPENRFPCLRKGGEECFAETGSNQFHSVFGGMRPALAPCSQECPAQTDVSAYMALYREGDIEGAAWEILRVNPMPQVTSRVCAHFCQTACNRGADDESVLSSAVERVIGDYVRENTETFYAAPERENGKSVAVVGGGAAGMSAACFLRRSGFAVTVYEAKEEAGGMLMYAIPTYRLPRVIVREYTEALERMGVVFKTGVRVGETIGADEVAAQHDSVLYTTGAWKRPVIGLSGEELTTFGLDFLGEVERWMDGKIGEEVFVAGGGNVAMDVAVTAKRLGARKVTLACLEPRDRMPASAEEIERAEEEGIEILASWGLKEVVQDGGKIGAMRLVRCISPWDDTGAFRPSYDESTTKDVDAQNILMAVGQTVDLGFLDEGFQLELTRRGLIDADEETKRTSAEGVFAAGDVTTGPATVIGAIAGGHKAADGIADYFGIAAQAGAQAGAAEAAGTAAPTCGCGQPFTHFDHEGVLRKEALKLRALGAAERRLDAEDTFTPTREEALQEASRCRNCACYSVFPSDTATALIALDAVVVTDRRSVPAEQFFAVREPGSTVLEADELITRIDLPPQPAGTRSAYLKMAWRKSIDFPVVGCAVRVGDEPRICLGAVAPVPVRATEAEAYISGKAQIDEAVAEEAGEIALRDADPFEDSAYKVQIARTLVKRALLQASADGGE